MKLCFIMLINAIYIKQVLPWHYFITVLPSHTTRKEAIGPTQRYQNQNDPIPKLLLWCMERSRDPLVPGGNTTRYQRLDIGTG